MYKFKKINNVYLITNKEHNNEYSYLGVAEYMNECYKIRFFKYEFISEELYQLDDFTRYCGECDIEKELIKDLDKILKGEC